MKFKFLSAVFAVLFVAGVVHAQGGGAMDMQINDTGVSVTSDQGSVMINDSGVSVNSNFNSQGNCTVNDKSVPCDTIVKGAGLLLLIPIFFFLIGLLLFIFWIVTLIHALTKPIENKIVWVIVIVFVPFGFILYYFIEMRPFNKKMMAAYKSQNPVPPAQPEIK